MLVLCLLEWFVAQSVLMSLPPSSHTLPPNPAGGGKKKEPEKPLSVVLQEFEASLDANVRVLV